MAVRVGRQCGQCVSVGGQHVEGGGYTPWGLACRWDLWVCSRGVLETRQDRGWWCNTECWQLQLQLVVACAVRRWRVSHDTKGYMKTWILSLEGWWYSTVMCTLDRQCGVLVMLGKVGMMPV